jgi:outer membrane protein OmpA-like peptidoglycan-associated protein
MRFNPKLTVLASLIASARAVSPQATQQLEEARAAYRTAAADPAVQASAPAELKSAQDALQDAERMAQKGEPSELVEHNAYLAEQRSRIALRTADIRRSEASIAAAAEERRRIQLEAREREAAAAREQAEQAQMQAQMQVRQAEMARKEAESRAAILEHERLEKERQSTAQAELGAEVKRLESELADMRAKQTDRGWILTLKNELLFDAGGTNLKPGAQRALDNLAQFLTKYPDRDIAIEGFTDSTGTKELNQQLSEKRAWSVKAALVARGIQSTRIDARGYGPSFPVASNGTPTGRQLNRRVEIVIDPS